MIPRRPFGGAAILAVLAACNPGAFDDLKSETWVDSSGAPEDLGSNDFGGAIVWTGGDETATNVAVAGAAPAGVAALSYAGDGSTTAAALVLGTVVPGSTLGLRPALAADTVTADPEEGTLAVGLLEMTGRSRLLLVDAATMTVTETLVVDGADGVASAVTFAQSDADLDTSTMDLFAAGATTLTAIGDYQRADRLIASCEHGRDATFALAAGDLFPGPIGDAVVAGIGSADKSEPGEVIVFSGSSVAFADEQGFGCLEGSDFATTIFAPDSEVDFGFALAVGDFDGSGQDDLAVSAPGAGAVYVWLDPAAQSFATDPIGIVGAPGFGQALAAADLDGDGADELVVANPRAEVDGEANAGVVFIYADLQAQAAITLHDAVPESDQRFGRAVAGVPFGRAGDILLVGTDTELFTYFQTALPGDTDPRE